MLEKKRYGIIYLIRNEINGKIYIGQTVRTFDKRYKYDLEKNTHNEHLRKSIEKYGIENFYIDKEFDIAYSKEELDALEIMYIKIYNTTNPNYGYNKDLGGSNGKHSKETKQKISEANKGNNNHFFGKKGKSSPVAKEVICLNDLKVFETCKKASEFYHIDRSSLSAVCKKKNNYVHGYVFMYKCDYDKLSQKEKEDLIYYANNCKEIERNKTSRNMSNLLKNKNLGSKNPNAKKIICLNTGHIFECIKDASSYYNINRSSISSCLNHKKDTAGKDLNGNKLKWYYYDEYLELRKENVDV